MVTTKEKVIPCFAGAYFTFWCMVFNNRMFSCALGIPLTLLGLFYYFKLNKEVKQQ